MYVGIDVVIGAPRRSLNELFRSTARLLAGGRGVTGSFSALETNPAHRHSTDG